MSPSAVSIVATMRRRVELIGKMASEAQFVGAQLHLVRGERFVCLDVRQQKHGLVLCALKWKIQEMAHSAVGTIRSNNKLGFQFNMFTLMIQCSGDMVVVLNCGNEYGVVLN